MNCAEAVIEKLKEHKTEVVFGYPGANIAPLYDALSKSGIRHVLCGNEQFAAMSAAGYFAATGKIGVCFATSGPGAVNILSGIANAFADSIPLVVFTGQVPCDRIGTDAFQEADITGSAAPFCKYSFLVTDKKTIKRSIDEAFYIASTGRRGPVLIDIPLDIQLSCSDEFLCGIDLPGYRLPLPPKDSELLAAATLINKSKRPLIIAGGGVRASGVSLEPLIKKGIPLVYTMNGRSSAESGELNLGMAGVFGSKCANDALKSCDLFILLGARATERTLNGVIKPAVHIDIDKAELSKNIEAFGICADLSVCIKPLADKIQNREPWIKKGEAPKFNLAQSFCRYASLNFPGHITADVGQNLIWTLSGVCEDKPVITSSGLGSMGFAVPAAIGAAVGGGSALAVCGDGGFNMSMSELSVVANEELDVKIVIIENKSLGMIRELQRECFGANYFSVDLFSPDYHKLAAAFGFGYAEVKTEADINNAFEAFRLRGGCIVRLSMDSDSCTVRR